jgi:membrane protein DedA with SNARE-associated domain
MGEHIVGMIDQYGLWIVFVTVLIGQIGLPIPAIGMLIGAGAIAADGGLSASAVFATAVSACLMADSILFAFGRRYGGGVLTKINRWTRLPSMPFPSMQDRFIQWGAKSLIVAKFVPGWTTIAPPLAGALGTSWLRFLILSAMGAMLWAAVGIALGVGFAARMPQIFQHIRAIGLVTVAAILVAVGLFTVLGSWHRQKTPPKPKYRLSTPISPARQPR